MLNHKRQSLQPYAQQEDIQEQSFNSQLKEMLRLKDRIEGDIDPWATIKEAKVSSF